MRLSSRRLIFAGIGIALLSGCAAPAGSPPRSGEPAAQERRLETRPATAGNARKEEGSW